MGKCRLCQCRFEDTDELNWYCQKCRETYRNTFEVSFYELRLEWISFCRAFKKALRSDLARLKRVVKTLY